MSWCHDVTTRNCIILIDAFIIIHCDRRIYLSRREWNCRVDLAFTLFAFRFSRRIYAIHNVWKRGAPLHACMQCSISVWLFPKDFSHWSTQCTQWRSFRKSFVHDGAPSYTRTLLYILMHSCSISMPLCTSWPRGATVFSCLIYYIACKYVRVLRAKVSKCQNVRLPPTLCTQ